MQRETNMHEEFGFTYSNIGQNLSEELNGVGTEKNGGGGGGGGGGGEDIIRMFFVKIRTRVNSSSLYGVGFWCTPAFCYRGLSEVRHIHQKAEHQSPATISK